jgi:predicted MFS family arabinose efflux permease
MADRGHSVIGTVCALLAMTGAFLIALAGGWSHSVILLALSGVLLDAGVQSNLVFGQRAIYTLAPEMRSRLNGMFMAIFFAGGAAGSALTSPVLVHFGWPGICALGAVLPLAALAYFWAASPR